METALVLAVPEAELVVADWRLRYDPSAAEGVPAHVTLLYPFLPFAAIDDATVARLEAVFAAHAPIDLTFRETRRFSTVLRLAPEDPAPISALIRDLCATFPDCSPYGGVHDTVVPHLTVEHLTDEADPGPALDRIERAFLAEASARLPVHSRGATVALLRETDLWREVRRFPLGGGA